MQERESFFCTEIGLKQRKKGNIKGKFFEGTKKRSGKMNCLAFQKKKRMRHFWTIWDFVWSYIVTFTVKERS